MPKRKRGGTTANKAKGGPSCNNSSTNEEEEEESYPHLRALLSLQVPSCCVQMCDSSGLDLIALPQCVCTTTLASTHVDVGGLPPPPAEDAACSSDGVSIYLKRLAKSQPCTTTTTAKGFTTRKQPIRTFKKLAMCRPCLSAWAVSSDEVETYDYNGDPNSNKTKFSVEVKCPQCGTRITRRAIQNLLRNAGTSTSSGSSRESSGASAARACHGNSSEDDEWKKCVTKTTDIVSWGNKLKKWAKKELRHSRDDAPPLSDRLSPEEIQLRDALLSAVQGPDSDDGPVHRHEVKKYELKEYLMAKDIRYRQDVEGEEMARALHEKIRREAEAEEEEERRRLEEDERMARELAQEEKEKKKASSSSAGHAGATTNERDRAEDEKKSEEAARILHEQLLKQDEEEKRLGEERDAAYARELHEREEREQRKRRKPSLSPGGTVRKSPFDGATSNCAVKDDETTNNHNHSQDAEAQKEVGVSALDQPSSKHEGENESTELKTASITSTRVPKKADAVYVIESSDDEDDGNENNIQLSSQALASPQSGPLSHVSSTASPAVLAPAAAASAIPEPPSLSRDGEVDTADTAPINDEKQSWGDENEGHIDMLEAMGFDRDEAKLRYIDACRDVQRAATMLFSALEARQRTEEEAKKMPQLSS